MEEKTYVRAGVLARAASGEVVPTLATVQAFVHGCGGNMDQAVRLWRRARAERLQPARWKSTTAQRLRPQYLKDFRGLRLGMIALRHESGHPTLRELEAVAESQGNRLPRSTLAAVLHGNAIPSEALLDAFVRACAAQRRNVAIAWWIAAWKRAWNDHTRGEYRRRAIPADRAVGSIHDSVRLDITSLLDWKLHGGHSPGTLESIATRAVSEWHIEQVRASYNRWLSSMEPA
ncbi:hypothetical protein OG280_41205 (plasmid) [Streptomyces virginiae]|uniref:hypothetical protein n=1 Tax=Streptomyces virginiae TaxID=1961 RepID=UPI002DDA3AEA|nr:hypothetical protein [Streptomyces virginiae]WSC82694.1 hypothetical protein OHA56_41055 [Streptomyces virginiae]